MSAGPTATGPWDAIVVGAGLGGLTTAAYLAANGVRTLVLEQSQVAGGCTQVFRRRGRYEFDVGVHYVGDCHPGGSMSTILSGVGLDDRIEWLRMDPEGHSTLIVEDVTVQVPTGWDPYLERLVDTFPDDERGLRLAVGILRRIASETGRGLPTRPTALPRLLRQAPTTVAFGAMPLSWLFRACRLSRRASAVLVAENGDYACPPSRTPIALHAFFLHHYLEAGAYYPRGGGQVLAAHLIDVIHANGGAVHTGVGVERIVVERGRATGVATGTGETIPAPTVVSNADLKRTFLELVGPEHLSRRLRRRLDRFRMALPLFTVYLAVDVDLTEHLRNTNYWSLPDADVEAWYQRAYRGELPERLPMFISSASVKDPGNPYTAPEGHSTLEVMTIVPPHRELWSVDDDPADSTAYRRSDGYRSLKQRIADQLVEQAEELIPAIRGHIVHREAATPITQERFTRSTGGACYGLELAIDQMGPLRPSPITEIDGLYLTGASTMFGAGILAVMRGGVGTASAILGRSLLREARDGAVFGDVDALTGGGPDWDPLLASKPRDPRNDKRHARARAAGVSTPSASRTD